MPISPSLSVQSKLIAAFVALTLTAIGVISWIGYQVRHALAELMRETDLRHRRSG